MDKIIIYKITAPDGKVYIGQTNNLERRLSQYKYAACHGQPKLKESLVSFGFNKHTVEEIDSCEKGNAMKLERHYIDSLDAVQSGLNSKGTGRKKKPESSKVRTKQVYLTDAQEKQLLKKHKKKTLTELLKEPNLKIEIPKRNDNRQQLT